MFSFRKASSALKLLATTTQRTNSALNKSPPPSFAIIMCAQRAFATELVRSITVTPDLKVYTDDLARVSPGVFKVPKVPFSMTVDYADTAVGQDVNKFEKTIVAVHGTPGYYTHFDTLVEHYRHTNVRVIAPNLPDFRHTRENGFYWHTTPERAGFLKQFLRELGVSKIDCLVAHSFGVQSASAFWYNPEEFEIRSFCLFAPQPAFDRSKKEIRRRVARLFIFNNDLWWSFIQWTNIHQSPSVPMKMSSLNEFLLLCSLVYDRTSFTFGERLEKLMTTSDKPITLVYGSKERLISAEAIEKFNTMLGIEQDEIVTLDPESDTADDVIPSGSRCKSYSIKGAGHFAHTNFCQFSNRMIDNLLAQISK